MHGVLVDLKLVLRQLRKSPGFAATSIFMLAFGIGVTTAIFSIVDGVLLRPLPFPDPDQLVMLGDHLDGTTWGEDGGAAPVSAPEIRTYERELRSFAGIGAYNFSEYRLSTDGRTPTRVNAARMTAGMIPALGIAPFMGRTFSRQEDEQNRQVLVLSYGSWKSLFHSDPQVVGRTVLLDRQAYTVIGVMPQGFDFPLLPGTLSHTAVWVPMSLTRSELEDASSWGYAMVGRLKAGVTVAQAQSDGERVAQEIMRNFRADMASLHIRAVVQPLRAVTVGDAGPLLRTMFLAVIVVLLIACANLAGLLLVRAIGRQREIAVRLAIGAPIGALLRQVLLESLVLSLTGGVLGIGLAALALRLGKGLLPESLPRVNEITLNWSVALFALALAVLTGLLCGLAPAFAAMQTNVNTALKEGGRSGSSGGSHAWLRSALVSGEIAIALVLVGASGLLLRSFAKMSETDLGFRPQQLTTGGYSLPKTQYSTQAQVDAFDQELLRRLQQAPGVTAAGITSTLPTEGDENLQAFVAEGYTAPKGSNVTCATPSLVMGDSFRALGIPLLRGRLFTDADRANTELVVIVNRRLARHYWPNQDPLGKRLRIGTREMKTPWLTVVGEVADVKLGSPDKDAAEQFYQPVEQAEASLGALATPGDLNGAGGSMLLRSTLPSDQMEKTLRATVHAMDPLMPVTRLRSMAQSLSASEAPRRFNTALISGFAIAAVLLALLGIYSVIAFAVASRVQEMAIRMALGSQRSGIVRLVLRSAAKLAVAGCAVGLAGAVAASGLLRSMLFGISPFDPLVLSLAAVVVLVLALGASTIPALRAAAIDPMRALRGE